VCVCFELNISLYFSRVSVWRTTCDTNTSQNCTFNNEINAFPLHAKQAEGKFWYGTTHT